MSLFKSFPPTPAPIAANRSNAQKSTASHAVQRKAQSRWDCLASAVRVPLELSQERPFLAVLPSALDKAKRALVAAARQKTPMEATILMKIEGLIRDSGTLSNIVCY
jgi:hypothetical protein